ncbi:MAG: ABC transporter substrate-binding protein [Oscillospiraceae bacterium]|nr:ABC transporter substrate-binding protein [Oscillospiraceae bacterium]
MKKILALILSLVMVFCLAACGGSGNDTDADTAGDTVGAGDTAADTNTGNTDSDTGTENAGAEDAGNTEEKPETIMITAMNGDKEVIQQEVPYDPQRIVILDMPSLDYIDNLGLGSRIVGCATTSIEYLLQYSPSDENGIVNCGTIKTPDLEAIMQCEPDVIFIGGRLSSYYGDLTQIAPVVYLPSSDHYSGVVEMTAGNARIVASMFGMEDKIDALVADYDARISVLQGIAEGKTAIVGICTSGGFNVTGNDGRCSIIGVEIGFENIGVDANIDTDTHGNEASFEFIVEKNPDYIFVMDRDAAIQTEGAQLAKDIMENELVMSTDCYKNGNLVILDYPNVWYTAEGGITALDYMLTALESVLLG